MLCDLKGYRFKHREEDYLVECENPIELLACDSLEMEKNIRKKKEEIFAIFSIILFFSMNFSVCSKKEREKERFEFWSGPPMFMDPVSISRSI